MGKMLIGGTGDCTRERTRCSCAAHGETQETEFVRAVNAQAAGSDGFASGPGAPRRRARAQSARHAAAYFGGLLSDGGVDDGGVELMDPFGLLESGDDAGGMVVVVPGEVD